MVVIEDVTIDINDPVIGVFPEGTSFKGATLSLPSTLMIPLSAYSPRVRPLRARRFR